jgi:phosphopantothenoylcysteine synthetase/decarboxylase
MGHSIAAAAVGTGQFEVVYIAGPVAVEFATVTGAQNFSVTSTDEMQAAVGEHLSGGCILVMAAAPADFTNPSFVHQSKSRKLKIRKLTSCPTLIF